MKKSYLLILLLLFVAGVNAQNCNFSAMTNPGSTIVDFIPNQNFNPQLYHFVWDFGDNTTSTTTYPTHTYNGWVHTWLVTIY
jgi:hypothetical protein